MVFLFLYYFFYCKSHFILDFSVLGGAGPFLFKSKARLHPKKYSWATYRSRSPKAFSFKDAKGSERNVYFEKILKELDNGVKLEHVKPIEKERNACRDNADSKNNDHLADI